VLLGVGGGYAFLAGDGKTPDASGPVTDGGRYRNCIRMAEYYERAARESRDRKHIRESLERAAELRAEAATLSR